MAAPRLGKVQFTTAALGFSVLLAGSLYGPAHAKAPQQAPAAAPLDCPAAVPVSSVRTGMTGQGLTVVRGKTPQPFKVEVLGVLANGVAPGKDMIVVEVSDVAGGHVVDQGGGIWSGMSGSPVYVDGKLLGAISYGFTASPSPIGGVTPAADMVKLLSAPAPANAQTQARQSVPVSASARARLATQAKVAAPRGNLQRLTTPLSVSGLSGKRVNRLQNQAAAAGLPVVAHAGGSLSASKATAAASKPVPGGNFAAVMSYGALTAAAVGTTTAVCGQQVLAFGHHYNFAGAVTYAAHDATALAIVRSDTAGSFKMATLDGSLGTVNQDRRAGLAARLGAAPASTPVTATLHNWDTRRTSTGTTRIVDQNTIAGLTPYALLAQYDAAFDEAGDGRASGSWTISGTRRAGTPFTLTRANRWASRSDLALEPADEVAMAIDALANNEFEPVTIKQVAFRSTFSTTFQQLRISSVAVSVNGRKFTKAQSLRVKAGAKLRVRVTLVPFRSSSTRTVTMNVTVPKNARGRVGALMLAGGGSMAQSPEEDELECLMTPGGCDTEASASSLTGVMSSITATPRNDDVVATLALESPEDEGSVLTKATTARQTAVVSGFRQVALEVR